MDSEKITEFLKSHDLISVNKLELKCGLPQSTIGQTKNGRKIPKKYLPKLASLLRNYGLE